MVAVCPSPEWEGIEGGRAQCGTLLGILSRLSVPRLTVTSPDGSRPGDAGPPPAAHTPRRNQTGLAEGGGESLRRVAAASQKRMYPSEAMAGEERVCGGDESRERKVVMTGSGMTGSVRTGGDAREEDRR
jgi:hypothetical protein